MLVQRWTSKPWPGVGIDWTHPLTRGLVGCWVFNEGSGPIVYNLGSTGPRNNGVLTVSGTGSPATWVGSPSGGGLSVTGDGADNASYVDCGNFPEFLSATHASIFVKGYHPSASDYYVGLANAGTDRFILGIWTDNNLYIDLNMEWPYCAAPIGWFTGGTTYDGTQSAAGRIHVYINGVDQVLTGTTSATSLTASTQSAKINGEIGSGGLGDTGNNTHEVVMFWAGRTLTAQDISDLHTNPWQIFQPYASYFLFTSAVESDTGSGGISAAATIEATGLATYTGSAGITASATIAATGLVTAATGVAGISAAATIEATGLATYTGSGGITASATIAATGLVTDAVGEAGISAAATIAATGVISGVYKTLVQRWNSKPWLGVGINWTHPLTQGLVCYWIFNEKYGPFVYNHGLSGAANDGVFSTGGTSLPTWVGSPSGGGVYITSAVQTGTDTYINCGSIAGFASATNASLFFMGRQAATPRYMAFGLETDPDNRFVIEPWNDGNTYISVSSTEYPYFTSPSGDFSLGATFDGSQLQADRIQGYANGVRQTLTGTYSGTTLGSTTAIISIGRVGAIYSDGRFDVAMMWAGRTLTDRDMSDLHGDPWQIFQPNIAYSYFQIGIESAAGSAEITAAATISATGLATYTGSAGVTASATIAATGLITDATGVAGITATGTISATGVISGAFTGSAGITAAGTISATGLVTAAPGSAGITASATIAATGLVTAASGVTGISASATISATGVSATAVVLPEIYPDPFAASLLTTFTPFSAVLSTTSTPFGATSLIGQVTSPRLTGRWYHLQGGGVTTFNTQQLQATFPVAVTEGSLIIVGIGNDTSGGTFSVSDNISNIPYTEAVRGGGSLSSGTATIFWYVVPQGGGGYPFTVTFNSQNGTYPVMSIDEYRPPIGAIPSVESFGDAEGNSATATIASSLSITHMDLVVATCKAWGASGQTITPAAGFQARYDVLWSGSPPVNGLITADEVNTNINTTPSFSLSPGSNWVMATAAFTPTPMPSYTGSAEITATGVIAAMGSITYESFMLLGLI